LLWCAFYLTINPHDGPSKEVVMDKAGSGIRTWDSSFRPYINYFQKEKCTLTQPGLYQCPVCAVVPRGPGEGHIETRHYKIHLARSNINKSGWMYIGSDIIDSKRSPLNEGSIISLIKAGQNGSGKNIKEIEQYRQGEVWCREALDL
jgi:hypothetical protein